MLHSLHSRLAATYFLLIGVILYVITAGLAVFLLRTPLLYPQTNQTLRMAEIEVVTRLQAQRKSDPLVQILEKVDEHLNVRMLALDAQGNVLVDTRADNAQPLRIGSRVWSNVAQNNELAIVRDMARRVWLVNVYPMPDGTYLLAAQPRPRLALLNIIRNDLMRPLLIMGGIALLLAFVLAYFMSHWISAPLDRMADATQAVAAGNYHQIQPEGPREMQELIISFNEMTHEVQKTQQAQRDFLANVSHELKTPLTSIQGFAQAILDGTVQTPETLRQAASVIHQEAERMHRMVLDLLILTRLQGGPSNFKIAPVNLGEIIRSVSARFAPQADSAHVKIILEADPIPLVNADGEAISQVFNNLVDNAIKYSPVGGQVKVSTRLEDGWVIVRVSDEGIGVPIEEQERIFERFYQLDRSRGGGPGRGVGLGLAICKEIVNAHGGSITVSGNSPQGSIFVVKMPTSEVQNLRKVRKS